MSYLKLELMEPVEVDDGLLDGSLHAAQSTSSSSAPVDREHMSESSREEHGDYYEEMVSLPILCRRAEGVPTTETAQYILQATDKDTCTAVPYGISQNVCFLVSSRAVGHVRNILSDGLGAWEHNGNKY